MISSILTLTLTLSPHGYNFDTLLSNTKSVQKESAKADNSNRCFDIQDLKTFTSTISQNDKKLSFFCQVENLFGNMHEIDDAFQTEIKNELSKNSKGTGIFLD